MIRALILAGEDAFVTRVSVLPGTQVVALTSDKFATGLFDAANGLDPSYLPDLIFLGEGLDERTAFALARDMDEQYPSIDLVLVGDHGSETILEAMKAGIREVLSGDVPDSRLIEVLRRARNRRAKTEVVIAPVVPVASVSLAPLASRTITVISPKGGVGKTSIATNMAIGLAEEHPMDVVLVDLDLQFGDVASTLDLNPASTMEDALTPLAASDNLVLKTMLTLHSANFYVLCGAESPAANDRVASQQIARLLQQLSMQFSYVIVDTAGGLTEPTLAALEVTDDAIIVSTMDVACVRGVRKAIELLTEISLLPASRALALNLADNRSGMKVRDVEAVIGIPVDVVIPRSSDVQLASNHGTPIMLLKKRGGPFGKAIRVLIEHVGEREPLAPNTHKRLDVA